MEVVQYIGRITSVQWGIASVLWRVSVYWRTLPVHTGDSISRVGDNISTVDGIQYSGGVCSTVGVSFSIVGDNISTVEVIQFSGDKNLKYYEFSKNLEIFSRAYFASQSQASSVDHG